MPPVSGGTIDLEPYREAADRFLADLFEEEYLHYAGLKETYELQPIYERFAELTTLDACRELGEAASGGGLAGLELWRFACEGYLGRAVRRQAERIAELETALRAEVDGESLSFRMLRPAIANEPDRERRERIELARCELAEQLNGHYVEAFGETATAVAELRAGSYRELYERFGLPLAALAEQCTRFLAETEDLHVAAFDRLARDRAGVGLDETRRWDVPRILRAPGWDDGFPAGGMLAALEGTLSGLGIDLRAQRNVRLDLDRRPTKSPRAFCAPIEVPGRIVLVIQPIGGLDDWRALFHEAGHTEHFAHTAARLPFEARRLGDNAVTEAWAFLLEHLVTDPAWLERRLDVGGAGELVRESATVLLFYLRRYCAKLLYELELHGGGGLDGMRERYAELIADATKVVPAPVDFLADVDPGFYCTCYLRAWALEAQLSATLRERFGRAWFADRKAGSLLRELWNEGQGIDADGIAREVTGGALELDVVADAIRARA
jgi:hypothetical protein